MQQSIQHQTFFHAKQSTLPIKQRIFGDFKNPANRIESHSLAARLKYLSD
jgi:hypothetical protein